MQTELIYELLALNLETGGRHCMWMDLDNLNAIDGVLFSDAVKGKQFFRCGKPENPYIGKKKFIRNRKSRI